MMSSSGSHNGPEGAWVLVQLDGASVGSEAQPTISFDTTERRVAGFAGCNRYGAAYVLESGSTLRFTATFSTKMACPYLDLEGPFLAMLERVVAYRQSKTELVFFDASGAPLAVFAQAP